MVVEGLLLRETRRGRRDERVAAKERPVSGMSGVSGHTDPNVAPPVQA